MTQENENNAIQELEALFLLSEDERVQTTSDVQKIQKPARSFLEEIAALDKSVKTSIENENAFLNYNPLKLDTKEVSAIHTGDTDSSDDEAKKNVMELKYNSFGRDIKKYLNQQENDFVNRKLDQTFRKDVKKMESSDISEAKCEEKIRTSIKDIAKVKKDVFTDPVFGIRIVNPVISSSTLIERMSGKIAIKLSQVKQHIQRGSLESDWVVAGCIVSKSAIKTSQKGSQYSIWLISDLHNDLKTISLFLFRNAHKDLWKTNQGTVIGILNPSVLERRQGSKDEACLSVDNPQKIMIFGQSKDLGICKSRKKNGDPCTSFVNTNSSEYCIFHIKQEYIQHSKRSEFQSTFSGRGLDSLRNKVLGKNEVFYAGQSYSALPLTKNKKLVAKDKNRLNLLSGQMVNSGSKDIRQSIISSLAANKSNASRIDVSTSQREKDLERLKILKAYMPEGSLTTNNILVNKSCNVDKLISNNNCDKSEENIFIPKLSADSGKLINLDRNICKVSSKANMNAIAWVKKNGPIQKTNSSNLKGTLAGKKRILEEFNQQPANKKKKIEENVMSFKSDRFKKVMEVSSMNEHLIASAENEKQEKYFESLEKKEAMEEKMLNTFKIVCKAVSCSVCKYTSFSASEICKKEKHPIKVLDACKRFFKCQDCSNRTVTLDKIPKYSCKNCQSSHWVRAPMIKERIVKTTSEHLSIRGDEETFIGSAMSGSNINLLVPE